MCFFFKTSYSSEEFKMVDIRTKKMKKIAPILKNAYASKIQLSDVKKLHLMQLCKKNVIPKVHFENFYKQVL